MSVTRYQRADGSIAWRVRIQADGETRSYGLFDDRDVAESVDLAARQASAALGSGVTLGTWGERWLAEREQRQQVRHVAKEALIWGKHVRGSELAAMPITRIKRVHVIDHLETIAATTTLSAQSIKHVRRLIVGALEHGINRGRLSRNEARNAPMPIRDDRTEDTWTWLSQAEIGRVLSLPVHDPVRRGFSNGHRVPGTITTAQRSAFVVAVYAGLRAGELWGLRWCDVELGPTRPQLTVRHSREAATKSGRVRRVPLLSAAIEALKAWRKVSPGVGDSLVWPAADGRCHSDGYDAQWHRIKELAQIDRRVRWHDLRHTCASHLVQGTWGRVWRLEEVRDLLGHESAKVTERYAHLCPGGLSDAAAQTVGTWLKEPKGTR
jgi:integrase